MSAPLLRFLELVKKELGSDDARIELGLREPSGSVIWSEVGRGFRVVASFDAAVPEPGRLRARLESLVASFAGTLAALELPSGRATEPGSSSTELSDALELLAHRARAEVALVIDHASPEIWGSSEAREPLRGVDDALLIARVAAALEPAGLSIDEALGLEDVALRTKLADAGLGAAEVAALSRGVG